MSSKFISSLLFLSILLCGVSAIPGSWQSIPDLKADEVQKAAKFAVTDHNKATGAKLVFESVLSGEQQVVAGMNYRLVISAKDGGADGKYEAVVWVKSLEHFMKLISFRNL